MKIKLTSILLLITLCLTSCNFTFDGNSGELHNETTKLSAPMNIRVDENNVVHWSEVPNATSYIIQIGDEAHQATTTELQYPISSMYSESQSDLYIKVKAKAGQSLLYSDSDWSAMFGPIDYVAKTPPASGEKVDTVKGSDNKNVEVFKCKPVSKYLDITNPKNYVSFTNGEYNFYIFHLGEIHDVALEYGAKQHFVGVQTELRFTSSTVSSHSIKNAADETVSNSSSKNYEFSENIKYTRTTNSNFGISAGITDGIANIGGSANAEKSNSLELGLSATQAFGFSSSNTITQSFEDFASTEEAKSYEETYTFNADSPIGDYLYVLMGMVKVYNVVVINKETNEFEIYTFTTVAGANRRLIYLGNDVTYPTQSDITLNFNIDDVKDIIQQEPTTVIPNTALESSTILIDLVPQNCYDNHKYNPAIQEPNPIAREEIDPDMLDLQVFGCTVNNKGEYIIVDTNEFHIGFKFLQDFDNIKVTGIEGSGAYDARIGDDSASTAINTNITQEIDHGTYWFKIHYKNGETDSGYYVRNFMHGKYRNDTIDIFNGYDFKNGSKEEIAKIEIVVVYEIVARWPGFLGIPINANTNWRYDYVIEFEK